MQIKKIIPVLEVLKSGSEGVDRPDMSLTMALALLHIASRPNGFPLKELNSTLGTTPPTTSRVTQTLGEGRKREGVRSLGFGLIYSLDDPDDYRAKTYYLTDKGKQLLSALENI